MPPSLGVDIEEVKRFEKLLRNKRFLNRVFTKEEIAYCFSKKNQAQHFAVRFAAKEAVLKAMGQVIAGLREKVGHRDIGLKNNPDGKPVDVFSKSMAKWMEKNSPSFP